MKLNIFYLISFISHINCYYNQLNPNVFSISQTSRLSLFNGWLGQNPNPNPNPNSKAKSSTSSFPSIGKINSGTATLNEKLLNQYRSKVNDINQLEALIENLSNEELKLKTNELKKRIQLGHSLDSLLPEAFAIVKEASWRILGICHYDVQLIGGIALHEGKLAEMATGEGKTFVAILPLYLNALSGEGSFLVTTNEYLARRDGETMGQVLKFLGLSVGIVQASQSEEVRKQQYNCDVTYVSNQELGFDYLRDNLVILQENIVQIKPFNFCIVDEADSILIDEARTPLIISRLGKAPIDKYITSAQIVKKYLQVNKHYEVKVKEAKVELTTEGFKYLEKLLAKSLYDLNDPWAFYLINAIKAKELFTKDKEYIITDSNKIAIVDSFTGRVLEGRRFTDGIQQSLEAKEELDISGETQVVAKATYQSLFKLFPKLAGMSGTAATEAMEFQRVYDLDVVVIPTALPIARRDNQDAVFRTKNGKMKAMLKNVLTTNDRQRPILIGTTSIESSEDVYVALKDLGVKRVKLLNAKPENIEYEADIVAQAGRLGSVTVATNLAGRGTDILLGGSAKGMIRSVCKVWLLHLFQLIDVSRIEDVIEDEENDDDVEEEEGTSDFQKAIRDAKAKKAIPGIYENQVNEVNEVNEVLPSVEVLPTLPSVEVLPSVEEDSEVASLPSIQKVLRYLQFGNLPLTITSLQETTLKQSVVSSFDIIQQQLVQLNVDAKTQARVLIEDLLSEAFTSLTPSSLAVRLLRNSATPLIEQLEIKLEEERQLVKKLGGLYVIGTSRHDARRIDLQLRGRAGRQGDPGSSRFFLSLEDDMFKVFGADKLQSIMENFRVAEDTPIESDLVIQALDKVQVQVEDYYSAIRQQVYRLDEVTSSQRAVVYTQRRAFLTSSDDGMNESFERYCLQTLQEIVNANTAKDKTDIPKLIDKVKQFFPNIDISLSLITSSMSPNEMNSILTRQLQVAIQLKKKEINEISLTQANNLGFTSLFRYLTLVQTDESWTKQLTRLELLKEEMILQSFTADKDLFTVFEEKAMKLFTTFFDDVRRNSVYSLFVYRPK